MEGMWFACEVVFSFLVGVCIYQEIMLVRRYLEIRRQKTKSKLRIGLWGSVLRGSGK